MRGVEGRGAFLRERLWARLVFYLEEGYFEVERFDLPPLRGGGRRGKLFIVGSVKLWEIP